MEVSNEQVHSLRWHSYFFAKDYICVYGILPDVVERAVDWGSALLDFRLGSTTDYLSGLAWAASPLSTFITSFNDKSRLNHCLLTSGAH